MDGEDRGYRYRMPRRRPPAWTAADVLALRRRLGLSQAALAEELGVRQQTVSEWETGRYQPRGASARLLGMLAEASGDVPGLEPAE
jgi:DNA-binding transcriptional regulator YiaG